MGLPKNYWSDAVAGELILRLIRNESIDRSLVAQALRTHRRTLGYKLKDEGTSFTEILDRVRLEASKEMLLEGKTNTEIGRALQFQGNTVHSSFSRFFRRVEGQSPELWLREREQA